MFARAPMRISYGGGGTDLDPYRSEFGGVCIGVAIRKYAVAKYSNNHHNETDLIKAISARMGYTKKGDNLIEVDVDAPPFSGLGASGAIAVSTIGLLSDGKMSRRSIAELAFDIERKDLGVVGGYQDQIFATYGGMIYIEFGANRFNIIPMIRDSFVDELENRTIIVYTGKRAISGSDIEKKWQSELKDDILGQQIKSPNIDALERIKELANEQRRLIRAHDLNGFCELLDQSWKEKRRLSPNITNQRIDEMYEEVHKLGASGKICGAGGGGYFMLVCSGHVTDVYNRLFELGFNPEKIKFDWDGLVIGR